MAGYPVPFIDQPLLSAATTLNATGAGGVKVAGAKDVVIYIKGSNDTVSAGAVQIEEADDASFSGTWSPVEAAVAVVQDTQTAVHLPGVYKALRTRISTAVAGGGTVSTRIVAGF